MSEFDLLSMVEPGWWPCAEITSLDNLFPCGEKI